MNLSSLAAEHQTDLMFVNFNQDYTSLVVGTKKGYELLELKSPDLLESIHQTEVSDVYIIERLFVSSLVAIVDGQAAARKLRVGHFKKGTEICSYQYNNTILAVKLNRKRLVVCLEDGLYVHNIKDMKVLHTIRDTPPNPDGICALSSAEDTSILAYPGSQQIGEVQIFDCQNLRGVTMIPAHDNPLAAMSFCRDGTKLATASIKGTVIRVFAIPSGEKLFDFRRGVKRCAQITSLAFSRSQMYLACSSTHETVHIFKLQTETEAKPNREEEQPSFLSYLTQAIRSSATYLPAQVTQVTDVFYQGRDFAVARLPESGLKTICCMPTMQGKEYVVVACQDGCVYIYSFDEVEGGECTLVKTHKLERASEEPPAESGSSPKSSGVTKETPPSGGGDPLLQPTSKPPLPLSGSTDPNKVLQVFPKDAGLNAIGQLRLNDNEEFPPMKAE